MADKMDNGIEPVYGGNKYREPFYNKIFPLVVGQLVAQNISQHVLGVDSVRYHQHWVQQACQHGRADRGASVQLKPLGAAKPSEQVPFENVGAFQCAL
jgi:hypothetical protein